ncbi:MAG TPA: hypothetical protein VGE12_03460 [Noviherbaspirillum sp.]
MTTLVALRICSVVSPALPDWEPLELADAPDVPVVSELPEADVPPELPELPEEDSLRPGEEPEALAALSPEVPEELDVPE